MSKWLRYYLTTDQIILQMGVMTLLMVLIGSAWYNMQINDMYRMFRCIEYICIIVLIDFVGIIGYKVLFEHQEAELKKLTK